MNGSRLWLRMTITRESCELFAILLCHHQLPSWIRSGLHSILCDTLVSHTYCHTETTLCDLSTPPNSSLSLYNLNFSMWLCHTVCGWINWVWREELLSSTWPADGGSKSPSMSCPPFLLCWPHSRLLQFLPFLLKFPSWSQGLQLTFLYRMTVLGKSLCGIQ